MLKDLNYIALDFEMTGPSHEKDEPIQIGIIKFDNKFQIKKQYKSLIRPRKNIAQLRNIISFITGLKLEDLENSPYIEELIPEIKEFFDKDTVIIGQSIDIDIDLLKKYTEIEMFEKADIFILSKTLFHFLPSYALEVVNEIIKDKPGYTKVENSDEKYHDALYDSQITFSVFKYCIEYIESLVKEYPVLGYYIKNSNSFLNNILEIDSKNGFTKDRLFLPSLKKQLKTDTRIYNKNCYNIDNISRFSKLYIGNIPLNKAISNLITNKDKFILAFSSQAKLDIIKKEIENIGIKNTGYLGENIVLNESNIKLFLNKDIFEEFEISFIIKYFSIYKTGYNFLDINSVGDYKIFNFLSQIKEKENPNIILTTHAKLYENMDNKMLREYKTLFFDWDMWYSGFSKYLNKSYDIYDFIGKVENIIYKLKFTQDTEQLEEFYQSLMIFTGVLFSEITNKFRNIQETKVEINPIMENIDFHKTNSLIPNLHEQIKKLENTIPVEDFQVIEKNYILLREILESIVTAERKMYNEDRFYFVFYRNIHVINYQEFLGFFNDNEIMFVTNFDKERSIKLEKEGETIHKENILRVENKKSLLSMIKDNQSVFILCTSKINSKELFEELYMQRFHYDYKILIENITGGWGKNIFYAQKDSKKILIGGYDFLMGAIAKGIKFDKIYIYFITGPLEKVIVNDVNYWLK